MKKGLAILLGIILVAGCSSNDTDELETQEQEESNEIVDSDENLEDEVDGVTEDEENDENSDGATEDIENQEDNSDDRDTSDTVANNGDLETYPEFDIIAEHIDLDKYQGVVETDNKGNRIILFEDENGHSEYKSIFIKHDNRLKIVEFNNDGLLYNEIIK